MFIPFATLTLAAAVASPVVPASAASFAVVSPVVAASVDSTAALTEDQLARYIAAVKALTPFWKASEHAALLKTAQSTKRTLLVETEKLKWKQGVYDYPALVKQDQALAAILTTNKFTPEQFALTEVAVDKALTELLTGYLSAKTTVEGKNVELVKKHRDELKAVGVDEITGMGMGGMGDNDELNP